MKRVETQIMNHLKVVVCILILSHQISGKSCPTLSPADLRALFALQPQTRAFFPSIQCLTTEFQELLNTGTNVGNDLQRCTNGIQNIGSDMLTRIDDFSRRSTNSLGMLENFLTCAGLFCQWQTLINISSEAAQMVSDLTQLATDIFATPWQFAPTTVNCFSSVFTRVANTLTNTIGCFQGGNVPTTTTTTTTTTTSRPPNPFPGFPGIPGFPNFQNDQAQPTRKN